MFGRVSKPVLKYVKNTNYQRLYNNTKRRIEESVVKENKEKIEKNLLSIPDIDKAYLLAFANGKPLNTVNKQSLLNKVKKDRNVRDILEKVKPSLFGKQKVKYIRPENYN